jgi:hypothetical protein
MPNLMSGSLTRGEMVAAGVTFFSSLGIAATFDYQQNYRNHSFFDEIPQGGPAETLHSIINYTESNIENIKSELSYLDFELEGIIDAKSARE